MSTFPSDLRYSEDHEWVRVDGGVAAVGISDFAQSELGDIVYVQVPEIGAAVVQGDSCSEVESTKSVSEIYAPVSGTVVAVNEALTTRPELVNSDPYGEGWMFRVEMSEPAQVDALMDAAAYQAKVEG